VIVVYKIDRLSRSLMDFAKLVEVFDRNSVTFVSVTQSFNTTTSMGRLTLNVLLSFAQFEREVIGERIRDKFAASRRKGMWMGGWAPLGYDIKGRKLVVNEHEEKLVQSIFKRFARGIQPQILIEELAKEGARNKNGNPIDKGYLYRLLHNRVYLGEAVHKGTAYPGEHAPIIERNGGGHILNVHSALSWLADGTPYSASKAALWSHDIRDDFRAEIREFLGTRRARVTPEQAGLPLYGGERRRVTGLRREEVALLAGISSEYYTRLERGNATGVKLLHHPVVGDLDLPFETFPLGADPSQVLLTYTAEPASPSQDALNLLASWAATDDGIERSAPANDSQPADTGDTPD